VFWVSKPCRGWKSGAGFKSPMGLETLILTNRSPQQGIGNHKLEFQPPYFLGFG